MQAVELSEDINYHLRDFAVMANSFVFYDNGALRQQILNEWPTGGRLMGYTDVSVKGEYGAFVEYAQRGIAFLGSDLAANLSLLSSVYGGVQNQKSHPPEPATEPNVHYVTFMMSDGDNVAYDLWSRYFQFATAYRGNFNMGWPMLPSMVDYAPSVMRWYYENASEVNGKRDNFIAQGGIVGTYFSSWPSAQLEPHVQKLNEFMGAADMRLLATIDYNALDRLDVWDKFTRQPNIDGIFYQNYSGPATGRMLFSNGKPIVDLRDVLWQGFEDSATLAAHVNSYARDPSRAEGYTAVLVHTWSQTLSDVQAAINAFAPDVRVVTPEEFMKLVRKNVRVIPANVQIITTNGALVLPETTVVNGGTVAFAQGVNYTNSDKIILNGVGEVGWQASLDLDDASTAFFAGPIDLGSDATIASGLSGGTLALNGLVNTKSNSFNLTLKGNGTTVFNGAVTGNGNLIIAGSGTTVLAATNSYVGSTTLSAGTLTVSGSIESAVTLGGGILMGGGTINNDVTVNGGVHAPGNSPGIMTVKSNYTLNIGGTLRIEINGTTPATQYDQIKLASGNSRVTLVGALEIIATTNLALGNSFVIITNVGNSGVIGTFAGRPQNSDFYASGYRWRINYTGGDGNEVVLTLVPPPAPQINLASFSGNSAQLTISTETNQSVQIQASTNLINWAMIFSTNSTVSPFFWFDTSASNFPMRFYRALIP